MKINLSRIVSGALFSNSQKNRNGIQLSESLFRTYRILTLINSFNFRIPKSDRIFLNLAINYYARILKASKKKNFIVAYSLGCPVEILYAMNLVPLQLEITGWALAMLMGDTSQLLCAANEAGQATEICSVHRLITGAFIRNLLPRVDAVIWTNMPCENSAKSGNLLAKLNDCPGFFLDHPYIHTPQEVDYLTSEFQHLISFLEETTGHKLNYKVLKEAIVRSNRQIELCREISQLRRNKPSPFPSFTFIRVFMAHLLWSGQPEANFYLESLRNELKAKARHGKGIVSPERFRLINMNLPPLHFTGSLKNIFQEHGAVEVVNPFFLEWPEISLDASQPLPSLARKSFMNPLMDICGSIDQPMLKKLKQYVSDYKIDGAINYAHMGCSSFGGASRLVRDTMKEAGVPMLELPCDIADPTVTSSEEMQDQLRRFFELLEDR